MVSGKEIFLPADLVTRMTLQESDLGCVLALLLGAARGNILLEGETAPMTPRCWQVFKMQLSWENSPIAWLISNPQ